MVKSGPVDCTLKSLADGGMHVWGCSLPPYTQIEVVIGVAVEPGAVSGEMNEASVSGGGAPAGHIKASDRDREGAG